MFAFGRVKTVGLHYRKQTREWTYYRPQSSMWFARSPENRHYSNKVINSRVDEKKAPSPNSKRSIIVLEPAAKLRIYINNAICIIKPNVID